MPTADNTATVTLTLTAAQATSLYRSARHDRVVGPVLGDFLVTLGGDAALSVAIERASVALNTLAESEEGLRRHRAVRKLDRLAMALSDLAMEMEAQDSTADYVANRQHDVHTAFAALGRQTLAKLPQSVTDLVASIPAGAEEAACSTCDHC